jgi:hypothetical protein
LWHLLLTLLCLLTLLGWLHLWLTVILTKSRPSCTHVRLLLLLLWWQLVLASQHRYSRGGSAVVES